VWTNDFSVVTTQPLPSATYKTEEEESKKTDTATAPATDLTCFCCEFPVDPTTPVDIGGGSGSAVDSGCADCGECDCDCGGCDCSWPLNYQNPKRNIKISFFTR